MSERVVCEKATDDCGDDYGVIDPEAPSVAEIVEELRAARRALEGDSYWLPDGTHRLDNLIARLEGA